MGRLVSRNVRGSSIGGRHAALALLLALGGCREPAPIIESQQFALGTWTAADVGAVGIAGLSTANGTTGYTLEGAGADIWTAADEFRFVYQDLTGDGVITARLASIENTNAFAKAGVMVREGTAANAKNIALLLTPTAANGYRLQNRTTTGGTTANVLTTTGATAPNWMRLERKGNVFSAWTSANGTAWTKLSDVTLAMTAAVKIGLVVTSHNDGTAAANRATAVFTNLSFAPAAPANLMATPGNNQVGLTWSAATSATSYTVKSSATSGGPYTVVQSGITGTSFTQSSLPAGTPVYYVVSASNATGTGPDSNQASATPTASAPPAAPADLTATAGDGVVNLSWPTVPGATSYTIKTGPHLGPYDPVKMGHTTTSFTHTGLMNGVTYYYVVSATNIVGEGLDSIERSATPAPPPPPPAPASLTATAGKGQIALSWGASSGATGYVVKSSGTSGGPYNVVRASVAGTSYTDAGLVAGTPQFYVVAAVNGSGSSLDSNQATATPTALTGATWSSQDIGSVGTAVGSFTESAGTFTVKGGGSDIYGNADAFRFGYMTVSGDVTITARVDSLGATNVWAKAGVMIREGLGAGARNLMTVVSPTSANKYRLQVRATADMATTSTASADTSTIPSWVKLERAGNTFRSYYSPNGTSWTLIGSAVTLALSSTVQVGLAVTSHSSGVLTTAVFKNVSIVPSPQVALAPPVVNTSPGNKQVHLYWDAVPGAASYTVKRSDVSAAGPYTTVASGIPDANFTHTGLTNGSTYHFVVSAQNSSGSTGPSAPVTASPLLIMPSVRTVAPADGATGVDPSTFVSLDLVMPNVGGGVDEDTLNAGTVYLVKTADLEVVPLPKVAASLNTSGGADVVVLQPSVPLAPQTQYSFFLTAELQDATGAPFVPFASAFTTGDPPPPPTDNVAFDKVDLGTIASGPNFTSITIGPDNRLYAATLTGELIRWSMNADGTLANKTTISTIRTNNANEERAVIGLTFDPAATSSNLILWVTHGGAALKVAPEWTGKLSKLTGASLGTYQDVIVRFPRSYKDHMTNSIAFKAGEPNVLYINQGSINAMGAPDNAWGQRPERLLAATVLRLDTTKLGTLPLDVETDKTTGTSYNPYAASAPLTIFATGVRNAYDLVWHSNGQLYVPTNGSAAGGNTPATPSPLPAVCATRTDGAYTGPSVPAVTANPVAEDDFLHRVLQGGYYGHPNPTRCEWVLNGGNPTSGADKHEVTAYPVGVQPDRNYRKNEIFSFGQHYSPNGVIEWQSTVFPSMNGKLIVCRYSGGKDLVTVDIDPTTKNAVKVTPIPGATGFVDPLDLVANRTNGYIYVTEHSAVPPKVTLLRPRP